MSKFVRITTVIMLMLITICSSLPSAEAEDSITAPLDELLPSRDDVPPDWWTGDSWNITLSEPGFVEGRAVGYYKEFEAYSEFGELINFYVNVSFYVFRFSNMSSAEAYCNKEINQVKSEGGYTEVSVPGAFTVVYKNATEWEGVSWGVISNIVFKVEVYKDCALEHAIVVGACLKEDPTDDLVSFTNLEIGIIPEFPSFLIFPLLMIATLLVVMVHRRKHTV